MNRHVIYALIEAVRSNPNGDPDAGGLPRTDPITGHGIISDVCNKSKLRREMAIAAEGRKGCRMYISPDVTLEKKVDGAYEFAGLDKKGKDIDKKAKENEETLHKFIVDEFLDVRAFGGVVTPFTKHNLRCAQINGPVQVGISESVSPVDIISMTLTRDCLTSESDIGKKANEMAPAGKNVVAYGLYPVVITVDGIRAEYTGFSEDDLDLLLKATVNMFEHDKSASRADMRVRMVIDFEHNTPAGSAPDWKVLESVKITEKNPDNSPRSIDAYDITIGDAPKGITTHRIL